MNQEDWERVKNFSIFKLWMTDEEIKQNAPWISLIYVVLLIVIVAWCVMRP